MRVFSITPALLLAVTSLAAAAPATDSSNTAAVSAGSDDSVQGIINIISTATAELQPLSQQLSTAAKASDVSQVDTIVSQINTVVSNAAGQLQTAVQGVELTSANLNALEPAVWDLVTLLNSILFSLVPALKGLLSNAASNTITLVNNLLGAVQTLTGFLQPFTVGTLASVLGPVLNLLDYVLNTVATLLGLN